MDINDLLYSDSPVENAKSGELLISEPMMDDAYFSRSVVLMLDTPKEGGHLGIMLNKITNVTLRDLMPDWDAGERIPIFCGGPVDMQRMFLIHTLGDKFKSSLEILPGIYVGGDIDDMVQYIESGGEIEGKLRVFLGYCGWEPEQLKGEIRRHSWAVNEKPSTHRLLDGYGIDYWRREVKALGESYRSWLMVPPDPSFN